ncbi:thymidine phosphorylase family protein [Defluviimonas sp. WL0075]|uniref:Putative thymidine phosphorylase n=1 Tax=Albidovulum sediminicola TaxID=2984331 RepID=A0ABT2Z345_9RHOB|nr:thymidine phosphorylase family protein [Defluviimonas sp. WL0075]MCV2865532.1 thymidine phosphorylase family protein [Defluviimonas sp. WL0075]
MSKQSAPGNGLKIRRLGIDTGHDFVIYMRRDCHVCRSEGFTAHTRIEVDSGDRKITAVLNIVNHGLLLQGEAGLSERAWTKLGVSEGHVVTVRYAKPLDSLSQVRAKIYGKRIDPDGFLDVLGDVVSGRYSDIHLSSFITACAAQALDTNEVSALTAAMIETGDQVSWPNSPIADKHCVGGLPGNRTTPIVVSIAAACGLTIPKTSSRAITSPAGTADTMETLAPVNLSAAAMRRVVEREGGCIVWGGAVDLSPADDILIRVERALDLDSEGQLVASVLSKKIAAGSSHVVIDIPVGETAKIRSAAAAASLARIMTEVAHRFDLKLAVTTSDGSQPVGRGIGPALEARDVLAVLQGKDSAPADLRAHALTLAGSLLELCGTAAEGAGEDMAAQTLASGQAWAKFQAICEAQGGMRVPPVADHRKPVLATRSGRVSALDNRKIARAARLAGAPVSKAAGLEMHIRLGDTVEAGQPLFTLHASASGELNYALDYIGTHQPVIVIEP